MYRISDHNYLLNMSSTIYIADLVDISTSSISSGTVNHDNDDDDDDDDYHNENQSLQNLLNSFHIRCLKFSWLIHLVSQFVNTLLQSCQVLKNFYQNVCVNKILASSVHYLKLSLRLESGCQQVRYCFIGSN